MVLDYHRDRGHMMRATPKAQKPQAFRIAAFHARKTFWMKSAHKIFAIYKKSAQMTLAAYEKYVVISGTKTSE